MHLHSELSVITHELHKDTKNIKEFAPTLLTVLNVSAISIVVFVLFVALIFLIDKVFIKNFVSSTVFLLELSSFPLFCFAAMLPIGFIPIFYVDYRNLSFGFEIAYHIVFYLLVITNFIIVLDFNSYVTILTYSKHVIYAALFVASGCLYVISIWFISNQTEFNTLKKCKVFYLAISYVMGIYNGFYLSKYILSQVKY